MTGWVLHVLLGGGMLLLLVAAGMALLRQPARRRKLGEYGMAAALLLAATALMPAWLILPVPTKAAAVVTETISPTLEATDLELGMLLDSDADLTSAGSSINDLAPPQSTVQVPMSQSIVHWWERAWEQLPLWLTFAYATGVAVFLIHWLLGHLALWRILSTATAAPAAAQGLFKELGGARRRWRLLISPRVQVPFSCGLLRPTIVLPAAMAESAPTDTLRWVLVHELAHLERKDAWAGLLFGLGRCVYFALPWYWWLRRQVRLCQEYVADAAAVAAGRPEDYAQFLLNWAKSPAAPSGATGVKGRSSDLMRRISMLLQNGVSLEKECPQRWSRWVAGGLLGLAVLGGGVGLRAIAAPAPTRSDEPAREEAPKEDDKKDEAKKEADKSATDKKKDMIDATKDAKKKKAFELWLNLPKGVLDADMEKKLKALEGLKELKELKDLGRFAELEAFKDSFKEWKVFDEKQAAEVRKQLEAAREQLHKALEQSGKAGELGAEEARKQIEAAHEQLRRALDRGGKTHAFAFAGPSARRRLGVRIDKPSAAMADQLDLPKDQGLVLAEVFPDSPAAKAGMKSHDVLIELDGKPVSSDTSKFMKSLASIKSEAKVDAVVLRKGKKETIRGLTLPEAKPLGDSRIQLFTDPGGRTKEYVEARTKAGGGKQTSLTLNNDDFTINQRDGDRQITIKGKIAGGNARPSEISINDGSASNQYDNFNKVPEAHRAKVRALLEMVNKGEARP